MLRFRLIPVVALDADWFSLVAFNMLFIIMISYLGTVRLRKAPLGQPWPVLD